MNKNLLSTVIYDAVERYKAELKTVIESDVIYDAVERYKAKLKTVIESDVNNEYSFRTISNVVDGSNDRVWSMEIVNRKIKIKDKSC